jgi:hypothetical protein
MMKSFQKYDETIIFKFDDILDETSPNFGLKIYILYIQDLRMMSPLWMGWHGWISCSLSWGLKGCEAETHGM